ncbi:MAG TPA: type II toxin-antitoxin system VapB family antitoxin [Candidatus Bathyarchaeia archaeon]|nr:type II toxin-antitoxin system VapB family antitoxin [Candidatus Bathyarchaeia archaeon]
MSLWLYTLWCTKVYPALVTRTNVVIDERLVRRVMRLYRLPTKRAAIDFALRALVGDRRRRDMLDLEGAGWDGDLIGMRKARVPKI